MHAWYVSRLPLYNILILHNCYFHSNKIQTNIKPVTLLLLLKKIEVAAGRVPSVRNGPRAVDLDILLYDSNIIDTRLEDDRGDLENLEGHLVVPHPRMKEREFVLKPLNE